MGLNFLGRGRTMRRVHIGLCHVLAAGVGGAMVGGFLGWIGSLLSLHRWQPWIIAFAIFYILYLKLFRGPVAIGYLRQVPRHWSRRFPIRQTYVLWGLVLGTGIGTAIPYSSFLILLATQLTVGPMLAAILGAIFGGTRQALALAFSFRLSEPERFMALLPALRQNASNLNTVTFIATGLGLMIAALS